MIEWTKSGGPKLCISIFRRKLQREHDFLMGKSCIIWIDSIKCYTYGYVLQHFMGFLWTWYSFKNGLKCVYFDRVQKKCAHMFITHITGVSFI